MQFTLDNHLPEYPAFVEAFAVHRIAATDLLRHKPVQHLKTHCVIFPRNYMPNWLPNFWKS